MSDHHKFEITLAPRGVDGRVVMDGEELKGVWGVAVEADCRGVSRVTITFNAQDVTVKGEAGQIELIAGVPPVRR